MTHSIHLCRTIAFALATLCATTALFAQSADNAWLEAPEASFLTNPERQEWWTLHSDAEREAFKVRYWARRDPTPGTAQNEFRDLVMQRIATADKKFTLSRRNPGATTWRGQVFVVFGMPARIGTRRVDTDAMIPGNGRSYVEGNEVTETWFYERTRTPKILDALNRPSLQFTFIVEPVKQTDDLQNPGLFHELRQTIADKTVVSNVALPSSEPQPPVKPAVAVEKEMTAEIASALDRAGEAGGTVRSSALWSGDGVAVTLWLVAPDAGKVNGRMSLYGRVKDSSGKTVATIARTVQPSNTFSLRQAGAVADATVLLSPGEYDVALMLVGDATNAALAAGTAHIIVPESQSQFSVSSLVLTDALNAAGEGLAIGRARVRPRADATFTTAESLWYLFQVANPSDPSKVTVAVRLRHGTAPPSSPTVVPAALESIGPARYMSGFEMPLRDLTPGDYTLYVSVHDPADRDDVVRRADFRVVEAPRLQ